MVDGARNEDPDRRDRAFDVLVLAYWKPVYMPIAMEPPENPGRFRGHAAPLLSATIQR